MIPSNIQDWDLSIAKPDLIGLYKVKRHSSKVILDRNNNLIKEYGYGKGSPSQWLSDLEELN